MTTDLAEKGCFYRYGVYGISLRSEIPLALPSQEAPSPLELELRIEPISYFSEFARRVALIQGPPAWYQYGFLPEGGTYFRWGDNFEFLLSADGLQITGGWSKATTPEAFQVYALVFILSAALIGKGFEPLHATCVVINGKAVAFMGDSGFGKSTLAACFLQAGCRLLTDDILVVNRNGHGYNANPGPPRIKLFHRIASVFLPDNPLGVPMNTGTRKLVIPLLDHQICRTAAPLKAIYMLESPRRISRKQRISVEQLSLREGLSFLLDSTYHRWMADTERGRRRFLACMDILSRVPVAKISYPRSLASLPKVRQLIMERF